MANRYTLNLRDIYAPDDVPLGRQLGLGIGHALGSAIDQYERSKELGRTERNDLAAAGATPVPKGRPPGVGAPPEFDVHVPTPDVGNDVSLVPGVSLHLPSTGAPTSVRTAMPQRAPQSVAVNRQAPAPAGATIGEALGQQLGGEAAPPPRPGFIAGTPDARGTRVDTRPSIGDYLYTARGGQQYEIDPLRAERLKHTLAQQEDEQTYETTQRRAQTERAQDADLLRPRYGADADLYAAHPELIPDRFAPRSSLTLAERQQLEAQRFANQQELQRLRNTGRVAADRARYSLQHGTSSEQRQALQAWEKALNDELRANTAAGANDFMLDTNNPNDRQQLADRASDRERIQQDMLTVEQQLRSLGGAPSTPRQPPTPRAAPSQPTQRRTISQAQYDRAIQMGHSDAEIAAAYDIDPSVRRHQ